MKESDENGVMDNRVVSCSQTGGVIAGKPNAR